MIGFYLSISAAKGIFCKTGRIASEQVNSQLIKSKCIPAMALKHVFLKVWCSFPRLCCEKILHEIVQYWYQHYE